MREAVRRCGCGCVVMHMKGEPATMQDNPVYQGRGGRSARLPARCGRRFEAAGIDRSRICVDPGPGFGKTPKQTIELMRNLHEIVHLGYPVMVAVSRKRFVGEAYHVEELHDRDVASAAEALLACELGASVVRTHNVEMTAAALKDLRPAVLWDWAQCNVALVAEPGEETEAKIAQLNLAVGQLCSLPDTQIMDMSSFYESEPAYYEDQDTFVGTPWCFCAAAFRKSCSATCTASRTPSVACVNYRERRARSISIFSTIRCTSLPTTSSRFPHPRDGARFRCEAPAEILPDWELADGTPVVCPRRSAREGKEDLPRS